MLVNTGFTVFTNSIYFCLNFRDIFDKMRQDLRLWKEETQRIETSRTPKVATLLSFRKRPLAPSVKEKC